MSRGCGLTVRLIFVALVSVLWISSNTQVTAVLRCHNCYGGTSDKMYDCAPSPAELLLNRLPKRAGLQYDKEVRIPNICLKMVTTTEGRSPEENYQTVIRMGGHMRDLTKEQIDARLSALEGRCTFEEGMSGSVLHTYTELCGCITDYCNGGGRNEGGMWITIILISGAIFHLTDLF